MKEIVIEISDETYEQVLKCKKGLNHYVLLNALETIANGKELPKGHKELIDTKKLIKGFVKAEENMKDNGVTPVFDVHEITNIILSQKVIVDADKGEE